MKSHRIKQKTRFCTLRPLLPSLHFGPWDGRLRTEAPGDRAGLDGRQEKHGLPASRILLGLRAGKGGGRTRRKARVTSPPRLVLCHLPKSDLQLVPAGQHGLGHRKLVCHARPVDILHHPPHHVQLLCRKTR